MCIIVVVSHDLLYFYGVRCNFFSISNCIDFCPFSPSLSLFFFGSSFNKFVYLSKDQLFVWSFYCLLHLCLFLLWSLWFLTSTTFEFCLFLFPCYFRYKVRLFQIFLVSWGKVVLLWTSSLALLLPYLRFRIVFSLSFLSRYFLKFPLWFHQ